MKTQFLIGIVNLSLNFKSKINMRSVIDSWAAQINFIVN